MRNCRSWFLGASLILIGCNGSIGDPSGGPATTVEPSGAGGTVTMLPPPGVAEPGRVTMRRLNQNEYDNTVHDLLGTVSHPARTFITDTQANGFDNNGDLLSLSPARVDGYQQAADSLAAEALTAPLRARNLTCDPATGDACLRTFVTTMGERAYRRPVTDDEITRFLALGAKVRTAGGSPDEVIGAALQAMLLSPNFLFRAEIDPDPASARPHALSAYELASRLSYLVNASMPDDLLFAAAKTGKLTTAADLQTQLQRLLADGKGRFSQNFAEQWLGVRTVEGSQRDAKLYPAFNPALGASMKREVDLFFDEFVRNNLPVEQLLTAPFTFVDASLAQLYGIAATPAGTDLSRVDLTATPRRGGLLGMAAMLTATSRGNRTSPVSRGRWVLDSLMCADPPPAPGDVKIPPEDVIVASTARAFLEEHRKNPVCFACHSLMDPIGLALENYDPIGAWRDTVLGMTIDTRGQLPDKTPVTGLRDLSTALAADKRLRSCLSAGLLTYSLGRSLRTEDDSYVATIAKAKGTAPVGFRDLLMNVVASEPFRLRRGEPAGTVMGGKQ